MTRPIRKSDTANEAMNQFCTGFSDFSVAMAMQTSMLPTTTRIMMQARKHASSTIASWVYPLGNGLPSQTSHKDESAEIELPLNGAIVLLARAVVEWSGWWWLFSCWYWSMFCRVPLAQWSIYLSVMFSHQPVDSVKLGKLARSLRSNLWISRFPLLSLVGWWWLVAAAAVVAWCAMTARSPLHPGAMFQLNTVFIFNGRVNMECMRN